MILPFLPIAAAFVSQNAQDRNEMRHHYMRLCSFMKAGESFLAISDQLSSSSASASSSGNVSDFPADTAPVFQMAGRAFLEAHKAWTVDWDDVTVAFLDASQHFHQISIYYDDSDATGANSVNDIGKLYESIAAELEDASTITGCLSVGPPSSVPNLEAVRGYLYELAKLSASISMSRSVKVEDENEGGGDWNLSASFLEAADSFDALLSEFD